MNLWDCIFYPKRTEEDCISEVEFHISTVLPIYINGTEYSEQDTDVNEELKDKNYTCFTSMDEDFGGTYIDEYVVTDGNMITARSAAASIDFAFAIINYLQGEKQEEKIKNEIYY